MAEGITFKAFLAAISPPTTLDRALDRIPIYSDEGEVRYVTIEDIISAVEKAKVGYLTVTASTDLDAIRARVADLDAAVVLRGTWSAAGGTFPGSGTAQAGDSWIVSTGGTVNGIEFAIGDRIIALADNASTSTYAANWFKADYTDLLNSTTIGAAIFAATAKTTLADADTVGITDSAASNILKKITWANFKLAIKGYADTLYETIANVATAVLAAKSTSTIVYIAAGRALILSDAGNFVLVDNAAAQNITLPAGVFPANTFINLSQWGVGQVSFVAGAGASITSEFGALPKTFRQKSACTAWTWDGTGWYVFGGIAA